MASVISKKDNCIKDLLRTIEEMQSKNTELTVDFKKLHGIVKERSSCTHESDSQELKKHLAVIIIIIKSLSMLKNK